MINGLNHCTEPNFTRAFDAYAAASKNAEAALQRAKGLAADEEDPLLRQIDECMSKLNEAVDALARVEAPCLLLLDTKVHAVEKDGEWAQHGPFIASDVHRLACGATVCGVEVCPAA